MEFLIGFLFGMAAGDSRPVDPESSKIAAGGLIIVFLLLLAWLPKWLRKSL